MQPQPPRTFIDDLVSYFAQKSEVEAAYFAFLYSAASQTHDLVLGVAHTGGLAGIKAMTFLLKQVYLKEAPMFFASPEDDPATFELAEQEGLLFFSRQQEVAIEQQLLNYLFDKASGTKSLQQAVRTHAVYAMVDKTQLAQQRLLVQPFNQGQDIFTPLFTSTSLVALSTGQAPLPANLALVKLTWGEHLAGSPPQLVVLNPHTFFEARFEL